MIKLISLLLEGLYNFEVKKDLMSVFKDIYDKDGYIDECSIDEPLTVEWKNGKKEKFFRDGERGLFK